LIADLPGVSMLLHYVSTSWVQIWVQNNFIHEALGDGKIKVVKSDRPHVDRVLVDFLHSGVREWVPVFIRQGERMALVRAAHV
jgi:hypothetical protein